MTEVIQRSSRPVGTTGMGCMKSSFKKVGTLCLQSDFKYPFKLVLSLPHIATFTWPLLPMSDATVLASTPTVYI